MVPATVASKRSDPSASSLRRWLGCHVVSRTRAATLERDLRRGWDIIADQPPTEIILQFSAAVADRVLETTWHPLQRTEKVRDGTLIWRSTVSGVIEIRLWILSWGEDVEVLEPQDLRDQVREILERAIARYG